MVILGFWYFSNHTELLKGNSQVHMNYKLFTHKLQKGKSVSTEI